jgi:hypothetical protein
MLAQIEQAGQTNSVGILRAGDPPPRLTRYQERVEETEQLHEWLQDENFPIRKTIV